MTITQRQHLLAYLGYYVGAIDGDWGSGSRAACTAFQKDAGITADGHGGPETDKALRNAVANDLTRPETAPEDSSDTEMFWPGVVHFDPEEIRCKCGGKYCDGFPHEMQPLVMQIAERARQWSGHPIQVISGLRCEIWNELQDGVENSQHKYGEALDVFFYGVTPAAALAWLQSQPDVRYAYQIPGSSNIHFDINPVGR
jgi:peptidoglycan hydrolase-like protein with peptidoglycan-binding domain